MTSSGAAAGLFVGAASIALFITAATVSTREFASARDSVLSADRIGRLVAGGVVPGISVASQRDELDYCYDALSHSVTERLEIAEACSGLAMGIVGWAPSNSFGWLIAALASAQLGDSQAFNARLLQSQVTGAHEQWVAEMRAAVAETYFDQLDAQTRANHLVDLDMLVHSSSGIQPIAQRYLDNSDFEERIVRIAETLPEVDQGMLLTTIRQASVAPARAQ